MDRRLLLDPKASRFTWFAGSVPGLGLLGVIPDSLAASTFAHAFEPGKRMADLLAPASSRGNCAGLPWWLARRDTVSLARFALRAEQETGHRQAAPSASSAADTSTRPRPRTSLWLEPTRPGRCGSSRPSRTRSALRISATMRSSSRPACSPQQGQARQAGAVLDQWIWKAEGPFVRPRQIWSGAGSRRAWASGRRRLTSYQFVVDVWRHADPELEPYVREARAGWERLAAEK